MKTSLPERRTVRHTRTRRPDRGWKGCVTSNVSSEMPRRGALCRALWENAWAEFVPFLQFDAEIRRIVCTTNAIESVNARIRKAVRARGHFPNEAAALKCVYMAVMSLDPTGQGRKRWTMRWKPALQAFDIAFDGRLSVGRR
jgi:transposase-like protein